MDQQDVEQELFEAVAGLTAEFGNMTVIEAMCLVLAMDVENDGCCVSCERKARWLHRELSRLLTSYESEFPDIGAMAKVNHFGPKLIQ